MAFVRVRGNSHQLIATYREGRAVRQRVLANLGAYASVQEAIEADPQKFGHLAAATKGPVVSPVVSEGSFRRQWTPAEFERRVQAEVNKRLAAFSRRLEAAEREARRLREENYHLRARKQKQRGET